MLVGYFYLVLFVQLIHQCMLVIFECNILLQKTIYSHSPHGSTRADSKNDTSVFHIIIVVVAIQLLVPTVTVQNLCTGFQLWQSIYLCNYVIKQYLCSVLRYFHCVIHTLAYLLAYCCLLMLKCLCFCCTVHMYCFGDRTSPLLRHKSETVCFAQLKVTTSLPYVDSSGIHL